MFQTANRGSIPRRDTCNRTNRGWLRSHASGLTLAWPLFYHHIVISFVPYSGERETTMITEKLLHTDGTPVADGVCIKGTDHVIDRIVLDVRSLNGINDELLQRIKRLVQLKHEVTQISIEERKRYVR